MAKIYNLDQETGEMTRYYSLPVAYLIWLFLGLLGGHWFYLGRPGLGVLYFLTCGLFGIGWIVDGINMYDYIKHKNQPS